MENNIQAFDFQDNTKTAVEEGIKQSLWIFTAAMLAQISFNLLMAKVSSIAQKRNQQGRARQHHACQREQAPATYKRVWDGRQQFQFGDEANSQVAFAPNIEIQR